MSIISQLLNKEMMQTVLDHPTNAIIIVLGFVGAVVGYNFSLVCQECIRMNSTARVEKAMSLVRINESKNRVEDEQALSLVRIKESKNGVEVEEALFRMRGSHVVNDL